MKQVYDISMINLRNVFENITKCNVKDFFIKPDIVMIIVNPGQIGKAIGKNGCNIKLLEKKLNKKLRIVEYSNNIETFIKNIVNPIPVKEINIIDNVVNLTIQGAREKGHVIGRDRKNLEEFKKILSKYFNISDIKVI